jgi:hypothetical protein
LITHRSESSVYVDEFVHVHQRTANVGQGCELHIGLAGKRAEAIAVHGEISLQGRTTLFKFDLVWLAQQR